MNHLPTLPVPRELARELVPHARIELAHPTLPGAVLVLWVYPAGCEAAWRLAGRSVWQGLPCEA